MDAKDILGLPKNALPIQEKKSKPPKETQRKPDGISREVYALTGGLAPLMPSVDVNQLKRKAQSENEKITWKWLPFTNSARKDDLQLYHWVRVVNGVPPTGDYSFAKYNKSVDVIKYTDEEYDKYLVDPAWTKEETDRLFDMCEQFDLRFIVIADRFPSSRTVEELKNRFYSVSRAILVARAPSPGDVVGHSLVKEPYNLSQEIERKRALSMVLSHSKQQERRDVEVLAEAKRISDARKAAKAAEEPELPLMADTGHDVTDKAAVAGDSVSPFPSTQLPSATIPNPVSETASVVASLRMVCQKSDILCYILLKLTCFYPLVYFGFTA
ncbi:SWR1-complex protein 4 isoform X2 [Olea europaea var. sylvestris]|uniref:SWR1-complex protein 4 isoform X2 n=1 Tax=Olea europaea var. sylvestris TaxID=158386 RepID=UPI000C1D35BA|nr:SWR1-complex protein 4 isoform X2 [Olea europaea var. sylvestris]